jgi:hypothetical protein
LFRYSRLLESLPQGARHGVLALVQRAARKSPGSAVVAPGGAVLQQDPLVLIMDQETG